MICGTARHRRIARSAEEFRAKTTPTPLDGIRIAGVGHCTACGTLLRVAARLELLSGSADSAHRFDGRMGKRVPGSLDEQRGGLVEQYSKNFRITCGRRPGALDTEVLDNPEEVADR